MALWPAVHQCRSAGEEQDSADDDFATKARSTQHLHFLIMVLGQTPLRPQGVAMQKAGAAAKT